MKVAYDRLCQNSSWNSPTGRSSSKLTINITLKAPKRTMVDIVILNAEGQTVRKMATSARDLRI
jgi:hypothetical protein